ncbi:MAG: hypothetical protein RLZZ127_1256 [Planctomycetota bacterium]|jgi:chromate transporter
MSGPGTAPIPGVPAGAPAPPSGPGRVFARFLRLGCTAFGGPAAHLVLFRDEFVVRDRVLDDDTYARLVALAQALPGPSSSQVGFALGWRLAGWRGALAAWAGFTLPAALLMGLAGAGIAVVAVPDGLIAGCLAAAMAAIAWALWGMRALVATPGRAGLASIAGGLALLGPWGALAGLGMALAAGAVRAPATPPAPAPSWRFLILPLLVAAAVAALAVAAALAPHPVLATTAASAQAGALVVGGGHVVLPWLQAGLDGVVPADRLLAGYGLAQAVPGPLFTLATWAGAAAGGLAGAVAATVAVFAPGLALMAGGQALGPWLAGGRPAAALAAGGAAVTGILGATFITTTFHAAGMAIWTPAIAAFALIGFRAKVPAWFMVVCTVGTGCIIPYLGG